jgi:hypothetical protein
MADCLLLCRHVSREDEEALQVALVKGRGLLGRLFRPAEQLAKSEPGELVAIAGILQEVLSQENVRVIAIRHSSSSVATTYATWLKSKLEDGYPPVLLDDLLVKADPKLDSACFMKWSGTDPADQLVESFVRQVHEPLVGPQIGHRAVLIVGHMPQLGWLARRLMRNRPLWTRMVDGYLTPLALKNGEIACIGLTGTRKGRAAGHLDWTIAPDDTRAIEDLRDKIKSKMDIAKLLGGFMTLVLGGVVLAPDRLDELSREGDRWAVYVAAVAFLIAIGLYLRTMYAYDALLMPRRFWGEEAPGGDPPRWLVRRPPASASWILYQNMLHIWTFLFTPATVAVVVGLLALAFAALEPGWLEGSVTCGFLIALTLYGFWRRPVLGSQD